MHSSDVLHDGLVLKRKVLEVLSEGVETVVDVIIVSVSS
jgi:hypothetical protein